MAGVVLLAALLGSGVPSRAPDPARADTVRSPQVVFPLIAGTGFSNVDGQVALRRHWSPFDVAVNLDGSLRYDLVITVSGLPPAADGRYVAWLATPALDRVERLGAVANGTPLVRPVDWNQILVVVTREPADSGARWSGPTVLLGRSRSALIRPLMGHSIFRKTVF